MAAFWVLCGNGACCRRVSFFISSKLSILVPEIVTESPWRLTLLICRLLLPGPILGPFVSLGSKKLILYGIDAALEMRFNKCHFRGSSRVMVYPREKVFVAKSNSSTLFKAVDVR